MMVSRVISACKLKSGTIADGQNGEGDVYADGNGGCFAYVKY